MQLAQKSKSCCHQPEPQGQSQRRVVIAKLAHQNYQHRDTQKDPEDLIHNLRGDIPGTQLLITPQPLLRNLYKLLITGNLVAIHPNSDPKAAVAKINALLFPRKNIVGAHGALSLFSIHKFQVIEIALHLPAEKLVGNRKCLRLGQIGAAGILRNLMVEPDDFAFGGYLDVELFLLKWLEPAV